MDTTVENAAGVKVVDGVPRRKIRWRQFSLRTLLVATAVVSFGLAMVNSLWLAPARRQRAAVQMVQRLGGHAAYIPEFDRTWLGKKMWEWLPEDFAPVNYVSLECTAVSDDDLRQIAEFTQLQHLSLFRTQVTDAGLAHLAGLHNLRYLSLYDAPVTDAGLAHLSECKQLTRLDISRTRVTDAGLAHLARLKELRVLSLRRTQVTVARLTQLHGLPHFIEMWLGGTQVTEAELREWDKSLPRGLKHVSRCAED